LYGFAAAIFAPAASQRLAQSACALERIPLLKPIPTERYPLLARRPRNSVLAYAKLQCVFAVVTSDWKICLTECTTCC